LALRGHPEATGGTRKIPRDLIGMVTIKTEGDSGWGLFEMAAAAEMVAVKPDVALSATPWRVRFK
jgi:hypothetical protein